MERGFALALLIVTTMGVVAIKLLSRSGVFETKVEWSQYLAAHTSMWLLCVPLLYLAVCEVARGNGSPAFVLTLTRALGVGLLVVFLLFFAWLIFGF